MPDARPDDGVTCARFSLAEFAAGAGTDPDEPPALLGGRYEVGRLIGTGGTARVYRAYDLRLGREVAVKIYSRDALRVEQLRRLREMRIQGSIDHPGVVALHDGGTEQGFTYLVMQFADGENLAERLLYGPLPPAEVTELAIGLTEALAHVHAHRVVHRDLKPGNIFLGPDGPLIGDFGIAHALDSTHITGTGVVPGTAAYLAPEQVVGEQTGPPADIYALGLILLECLTGEREYTGTLAETAVARLARQPRIPDGLPAPLTQALQRMTAREPADRPTALEAQQLLKGLPVPVRATAPASGGERPSRRRRLGFAAAAVAGAAATAVLSLTLTAPQTSDTNPAEQPAVDPPDTVTAPSPTPTGSAPSPRHQASIRMEMEAAAGQSTDPASPTTSASSAEPSPDPATDTTTKDKPRGGPEKGKGKGKDLPTPSQSG